jgi:hypothetical protein
MTIMMTYCISYYATHLNTLLVRNELQQKLDGGINAGGMAARLNVRDQARNLAAKSVSVAEPSGVKSSMIAASFQIPVGTIDESGNVAYSDVPSSMIAVKSQITD